MEEAYSIVDGSREWNVKVTRNLNDWEVEEYEALLLLLSHIQFDNHKDQMWKLRKQGEFSIKSLSKHLTSGEGRGLIQFPAKQFWKTKAPPRVAFVAWEACRKCILIINRLMRMGKIMIN